MIGYGSGGGEQQNQNKHFLPLTHTNTLQSSLNPSLNQQQIEIANFLQERNITTLCHFTDAQNLPNILKYGLLSREVLDKLNTFTQGKYTYKSNDEMRLDRKPNYISLSISKINDFLLNSFLEKGSIENCAIVEIDARILYEEIDNHRFYCQTNAATTGCKKGDSLADFEALFDNQVNYKGRMLNRENLNINQSTDAQAEILWAGWVKPKFIKQHYIKNKKEFFSVRNVNFNLGGTTMRFPSKSRGGIRVKLVYRDGGFENIKFSNSDEFEKFTLTLDDSWELSSHYYLGRMGYPIPEKLTKLPEGSFVIIKEDV